MDLPVCNTLSKEERLYCKKDITELLAKGRYGNIPGMRFCIRRESGAPVNRIMISVSKKYFKRAVKRNLLKRRIRESYRLQKSILPSNGGIDILFIYNSKEVMSSQQIYELVGQILRTAAK
ncbi:MAG: ribonuclease P protein component [Bacteroidales bacterium]|nr:ribonuclease P protein component [Candidatus Cryptobacteroides caccocaballi]